MSGPAANDPIAAVSVLRYPAAMKATFLAIALTIGSCSLRPSGQDAVIRVIESVVTLPSGARALGDYSRNYALRPDGKVIAVYVTPQPTEMRGDADSCEVMLDDFSSRPCTETEQAEVATQDEVLVASFGNAGQSRWFDDYRDLPLRLDGGCTFIEIIFDPASQQIESTQCNGGA